MKDFNVSISHKMMGPAILGLRLNEVYEARATLAIEIREARESGDMRQAYFLEGQDTVFKLLTNTYLDYLNGDF